MIVDSTFTVMDDNRDSVPSLIMKVVLLIVNNLLPFSWMGDRSVMVDHHIEAVVPYLANSPNHRITVSDDYHRTGDSLVGKLQLGIVRRGGATKGHFFVYLESPNPLM